MSADKGTLLAHPLCRDTTDEQHADVLETIATADEPPTSSEIALETHRSDRQVRRILSELRDAGRVRRLQDPDDGRRYRYGIVLGGVDDA